MSSFEHSAGTSRIALVGGGLAGPLLAIYLSRRGFGVDIYERRPDMRKQNIAAGRSINLALSTRGLHALKEVGVRESIMKIAIPMKGRMIHSLHGELTFQRYGRDDSEVIYAASRGELNKSLLTAAEQTPGVRIVFDRRCTGIDPEKSELFLRNESTGDTEVCRARPVIGTDGSASAIRMEMQKSGRFNFSQEYLDYGYKELVIPAGPGGRFLLEKNALHIWPRTTFMLIALPNIDGSFTVTFFFPFTGEMSFETLRTPEQVLRFFANQFPDAVPLMPGLVDDFFGNPTGSMVTIRCSPWHIGDRAALLGDAAHAIVPFFGQGMNCAFESCTVLDEILGKRIRDGGKVPDSDPSVAPGLNWEEIFAEFESRRKVDTDAIAELALENFIEMRDLVARADFQLKKKIEQALQARWPDRFVPKYSMVTFRRMPYSEARKKGKLQDRILDVLAKGIRSPDHLDWKKAERLVRKIEPARDPEGDT